jgi:hypothetical protein
MDLPKDGSVGEPCFDGLSTAVDVLKELSYRATHDLSGTMVFSPPDPRPQTTGIALSTKYFYGARRENFENFGVTDPAIVSL